MLPALTLCALSLFLAAAVTDARERRIPNFVSLGLALAGMARIALALAAGASPLMLAADLAAAAGVFVIGAVAFHFRLLGGGDVKLLAAGALWVGAVTLPAFLVATVLAGGVLALGFIVWRVAAAAPRATALPYGIAIAAGGLLTTGGLPWT